MGHLWDKVGWTDIYGNFFKSKFLAIKYNKKQNLSFYMYEDIFSRYDWSKPLNISYEILLKERAQQLRDNYDYLRVWYTSGCDSQTMLNTFLKHKIFIDEITIIRSTVVNDPNKLESEREITRRALPFLEKTMKNIPKTKLNIVTMGPDSLLKYFEDPDYILNSGSIIFRGPIVPAGAYNIHKRLDSIHDKYARVANIQGQLKPRLDIKDGHFYAYNWDNELSNITMVKDIECFFTTPDLPLLHIKQCQILKEHIKYKYPDIKNSTISENNEFKYDIEDCIRDMTDRSADLKKEGSNNLLTNKNKFACLEAVHHAPKVFESYKERLRELNSYNNIIQNRHGIKTKEFYLGN